MIQIEKLYVPDLSSVAPRPLFLVPVSAGFPSPAEDYLESRLDLNQYLIPHESTTFFVRVKGDSMTGAHIQSGDLLIVDRSLEPTHNTVIIAVVNGELTLKRLCKRGHHLALMPENGTYDPIQVTESTELEVWGVVTYVIHAVV